MKESDAFKYFKKQWEDRARQDRNLTNAVTKMLKDYAKSKGIDIAEDKTTP